MGYTVQRFMARFAEEKNPESTRCILKWKYCCNNQIQVKTQQDKTCNLISCIGHTLTSTSTLLDTSPSSSHVVSPAKWFGVKLTHTDMQHKKHYSQENDIHKFRTKYFLLLVVFYPFSDAYIITSI